MKKKDRILRATLWLCVPFNLAAAAMLLNPDSALGQLAGLPPAAPLAYRALLAMFVALFGAMYAWLALQPGIVRPLVGLAACGKGGAFAVVVALILLGDAPLRGLIPALGDLAFAAVFVWWLMATRIKDPEPVEL